MKGKMTRIRKPCASEFFVQTNIPIPQWRSQGGVGGFNRPHPEPERKMILFPTALFLPKTLPKIDKNSIFLLNFHQIFPNQLCFSPKLAKS